MFGKITKSVLASVLALGVSSAAQAGFIDTDYYVECSLLDAANGQVVAHQALTLRADRMTELVTLRAEGITANALFAKAHNWVMRLKMDVSMDGGTANVTYTLQEGDFTQQGQIERHIAIHESPTSARGYGLSCELTKN